MLIDDGSVNNKIKHTEFAPKTIGSLSSIIAQWRLTKY